MALIGRLFVIFFGFLAACLVAGIIVVAAVLFPELGGLDGGPIDQSAFDIVLGFSFIFISGFALLPAMIIAAITEAFCIRGVLAYAVGGGLVGLACYLGLVPFDPDTLHFEGIVRRHLEIMTGAGIVAGLVYWMIAGRNAGAWRAPAIRPPPPSRGFPSAPRSSKPPAMNRTGLFVALSLALTIGIVFGLYPELDLKLAALFYDVPTRSFPLKLVERAAFARDAAMWIAWAIAVPAIAALLIKLLRPDRPLLMSGRAIIFLLLTLTLSAGVLTNLTFKSYWGRPRPVLVTEFGGTLPAVAWWDPHGGCGRNCSFFSGESATAFWTLAPAALTPPAWRPLAYAAATLFGLATSVLRMAFGGHFFTDIAAAGLMTYLVIWLVHGFIYRWPRTRLSDAGIDAALTRLFWPAYRLRQRWRGREAGPAPSM